MLLVRQGLKYYVNYILTFETENYSIYVALVFLSPKFEKGFDVWANV